MSKIKIILYIVCFFIIISEQALAGSFEDGVKAYNSGKYVSAESHFRKALNANQDNAAVKYYLAISCVHNKKFSDAKILYKNIIQTASDKEVISLSQTGLKLLGDNSVSSSSRVNKVVLNVSSQGSVIIVDNVNLNDKEKVKFIFDTGASYTTISSALAEKLRISTSNVPKIKIMTGSGYIEAPKVILKKIEINGLTAYNVETLVADLPMHTSGSAGEIAGMLGLSFMKDYKVTVDKAHDQITLEKNQ